MSEHSTPNSKVVVVGGGYAGAVAANRLRMRSDVDITLVNPRPKVVDRVRLHQFVAGTGEAEVDYGTLLGDEVRLVVDSATRIDTAARAVELASGRTLDYDHVIRAVTLVCGTTLAPTFSAPGRRSIARWLSRHGVAVLENDGVAEVGPDAVVLASGVVRSSAVTVWAAGFGVPELARASGLRTDALGRLLTDETLTSVDDDRVVAAGDAAAPSGLPLRMSSYAAGPLGAQAVDTVLSRIAGTDPAVLSVAFRGRASARGVPSP